jgi:hypothetical protein
MEDQPRSKGSWLHAISLAVVAIIGLFSVITAFECGFKGDGGAAAVAAAVAFGVLAMVTKPRD